MRNYLAMPLVLIMATLMSCDMVQNDQVSSGTGNVVVRITDAPFPVKSVDKVLVTIDTVELRVEGGACIGKHGEPIGKKPKGNKGKGHDYSNFDCDSGYVVISTKQKEFDLLQLQNGVSSILAEATIPVGKYDIIRMEMVKATIVMNGYTFEIKIPAEANSGLKIKLDTVLVVTGSGTSEALVDIDLSRSFLTLGDQNSSKGILGFVFKPILRAVNHKHAGSIYGKVYEGTDTPVTGVLITVTKGDVTVTTAITDNKGLYKVIGLPGGIYKVTASKTGYKTEISANIKITPNSEIKQDFKLIKQ